MLVNSHLVCQPRLGFLSLLYFLDFESPYITSQGKPSSGNLRGKRKGADQEARGVVT